MDNGYPEHIVDRVVKDMEEKADQPVDSNATNYVTICLPWLGRVSNNFHWDINAAIAKGFLNTQPRVVFTPNKKFSGCAKDVLPTTAKNSVV